jgi:alpha-1,3-mannosyltransferase
MKEHHYLPIKQRDDNESGGIQQSLAAACTVERTVVPWMPAISTLLLSLVLFAFFGMPSTLLIYLSFLAIYALAGGISLIGKVTLHQQRLAFSPVMGVAFALIVFPLLIPSMMPPHALLILPPSPPTGRSANSTSIPPYDVLFVAANLFNSEAILPRFSASLFELAKAVGEDNIFISIYESNSNDKTKEMLTRFEADLTRQKVPHHIEMASTHDHIGVEGNYNRIDFLAKLRNKVYDALDVQPGASYKSRVNRVLWLNDILFDSASALDLLNTNEGRYDVACGLDYVPLGVYDT